MKHETKKIFFKNSIFRCIALFLAQTRELREHAPPICLSIGLALPHLFCYLFNSPLCFTQLSSTMLHTAVSRIF